VLDGLIAQDEDYKRLRSKDHRFTVCRRQLFQLHLSAVLPEHRMRSTGRRRLSNSG